LAYRGAIEIAARWRNVAPVGLRPRGGAKASTRSAAAASSRRRAKSLRPAPTKGDEIALARCDLDLCNSYNRTTFNFDIHGQPRAYRMIVERKGRNLKADGTQVRSER
jgi:hypothetical protein